jgi:hypothetical protein
MAMPQKSNDTGFAEPRASVPQNEDDELEMSDEEEEDDEHFDADGELEEDDVED